MISPLSLLCRGASAPLFFRPRSGTWKRSIYNGSVPLHDSTEMRHVPLRNKGSRTVPGAVDCEARHLPFIKPHQALLSGILPSP